MNVLGISSSPRRDGNSETLLDHALEGAKSKGAVIEKIVLNKLSFKPCQECGGCDKTGVCVISDGMDIVYKKIKDANAVIIASPVFFGSLTAQAKAMIDRFQCSWIAKQRLNKKVESEKKGAFLCVGAIDRADFFDNARHIIKNLFATIGIKYAGELFVHGAHDRSDILKNKEALGKAFALGASLVR